MQTHHYYFMFVEGLLFFELISNSNKRYTSIQFEYFASCAAYRSTMCVGSLLVYFCFFFSFSLSFNFFNCVRAHYYVTVSNERWRTKINRLVNLTSLFPYYWHRFCDTFLFSFLTFNQVNAWTMLDGFSHMNGDDLKRIL